MSTVLYTCLTCGHFNDRGFLASKPKNTYDYECPNCHSTRIDVDYENEGESITEVETTDWDSDDE